MVIVVCKIFADSEESRYQMESSLKDGRIISREWKTDGIEPADTMTRREMKSLLSALKRIQKPCNILLFLHSDDIATALNNGWYRKWQQNDWKNGKGKLVRNFELWQQISEEMSNRSVIIKAESGIRWRED